MDMDQLKSKNQLDIMMMIQETHKISDQFDLSCDDHDNVTEFPPSDHFSGATGSSNIPRYIDQNLQNISSPISFMNFPPSIAFANPNPSQEQYFLSNPKWRRTETISPNNHYQDTMSTAPLSQKRASMAAMREMIFRIAAMQPINIDPESIKPAKRRNVKISKDPQSVAARHRRERISERIRILQRLVPGGTKMDTASMLDEAIHYVKFLKSQVQSLERVSVNKSNGMGFPVAMSTGSYVPMAAKACLSNYGDSNQQWNKN